MKRLIVVISQSAQSTKDSNMNHESYARYAPALGAYLNASVSGSYKKWSDVVKVFFEMNKDNAFSSMAEIAEMFGHLCHPHYFLISVEALEPFFIDQKLSKETLVKAGFKDEIDFIDDEGLRMTFLALRRLIARKGDFILEESFAFIERVHWIHHRYTICMGNRARVFTHWTLIERIDNFISSMKPHENGASSRSFRIMDTQPRVFCVIKGTQSSVVKLAKKYTTKPDQPYKSERMFPIYTTVLADAREEVACIFGYIDENYIQPYRYSQLGTTDEAGEEITKLTRTKCCVRLLSKYILVDPTQSTYTPEMLLEHIDEVRTKLKQGRVIAKSTPVSRKSSEDTQGDDGNFTSIEIFEKSKGEFIDEYQSILLSPYFDDSAVIDCGDIAQYGPVIQDLNDIVEINSVASGATEFAPAKPKRERTISNQLEGLIDTIVEHDDNIDSDDESDNDNIGDVANQGRTRRSQLKIVGSRESN